MEIDCVLAIGVDTPEHIALAEQLGYTRAWCHEAPRSYADASMALAVAAERTSRIRLGLVVAGLTRQAETDAAAVDDLASRAPGRADLVVCAHDTGTHDESGRRDLARHAGGEHAAAADYLAAVRAAIPAERIGVWTATAGGFRAAGDAVAARTGMRVVELDGGGAGLPAALAADRAAQLGAERPQGVLFRPQGPEIGRELAEFAAAVHARESAGAA